MSRDSLDPLPSHVRAALNARKLPSWFDSPKGAIAFDTIDLQLLGSELPETRIKRAWDYYRRLRDSVGLDSLEALRRRLKDRLEIEKKTCREVDADASRARGDLQRLKREEPQSHKVEIYEDEYEFHRELHRRHSLVARAIEDNMLVLELFLDRTEVFLDAAELTEDEVRSLAVSDEMSLSRPAEYVLLLNELAKQGKFSECKTFTNLKSTVEIEARDNRSVAQWNHFASGDTMVDQAKDYVGYAPIHPTKATNSKQKAENVAHFLRLVAESASRLTNSAS